MAKGNIEYHHVDDWDSLRYFIDDYFTHFQTYIYRGQAQSNWILEPTISRALKKIPFDIEDNEVIKSHLMKFKNNIRGRRGENPKELNENELWALGQHYGLYTPLLDWSRSPYVGLFFAFANPVRSRTKDRVLWAIDVPSIEIISENYLKDESKGETWKLEIIDPPLDENSRLVSQAGLFTKVPISIDIEQWVKKGKDTGGLAMYKFTIPDNLRNDILCALNNMNINYTSLFPDLTGASYGCNLSLNLDPYMEEMRLKEWDMAMEIKSG